MTERLYFRQLLSGRDFAQSDPIAQQMRNFSYLIGDRETGDTVVVDPAYAAGDLVDALEADGMHLSGVLVTHHHPDHVGGSMMGFELNGLADLLELKSVPVHVNSLEADWVSRITGIARSELTGHEHGDKVSVGDIGLSPRPSDLSGTQSGSLNEDAAASVSGSVAFTDVDLSDGHTAAFTGPATSPPHRQPRL